MNNPSKQLGELLIIAGDLMLKHVSTTPESIVPFNELTAAMYIMGKYLQDGSVEVIIENE